MPRDTVRIALTIDEAARLLALTTPRTSSDMALLARLSELIAHATTPAPPPAEPDVILL